MPGVNGYEDEIAPKAFYSGKAGIVQTLKDGGAKPAEIMPPNSSGLPKHLHEHSYTNYKEIIT